MVAGTLSDKNLPLLEWEEIAQHNEPSSRWLVIDGIVYDVTRWAYKHPGGSKIIGHYAGQDASEPFRAFHNDTNFVRKYLTALRIGRADMSVKEGESDKASLKRDFEDLRLKAHEMGLFKTRTSFFLLHFFHIVAMEVLSWWILYHFGTGWIPCTIALLLYATVQTQSGWLQHDFGHLSVFRSARLNHIMHQVTMSFLKGASSSWWNHMHYQHHSKPNVMEKDPDVRIQPLFVIGEKMPLETAQKKSKFQFPYQLQHKYFFAIGPPLLFPVYFQFMTFRHAITRRCYVDLALMAAFFTKLLVLGSPLFGYKGAFLYYFLARLIESHWFTWVSQSNHIPMEIDHDIEKAWLMLQIHATCDVKQSAFNDWFTGHLNFQIEHHLFPTMPRHSYHKIQPLVRELCEKHKIPFQVKSLPQAFVDIIRSLRHSGELWYAAYHAHHLD